MKFSEMKPSMAIKVVADYADCIKKGDTLYLQADEDDPTELFVTCIHGRHYLKSSLDKHKSMPEFERK